MSDFIVIRDLHLAKCGIDSEGQAATMFSKIAMRILGLSMINQCLRFGISL